VSGPVTIRYAREYDVPALARLAQLDSAAAPLEPVLIAQTAGELVAAISLADATVVANPFRPTADIVELLRARERQIRNGRSRRFRLRRQLVRRRLRATALS
jgi:hypothetical protein